MSETYKRLQTKDYTFEQPWVLFDLIVLFYENIDKINPIAPARALFKQHGMTYDVALVLCFAIGLQVKADLKAS